MKNNKKIKAVMTVEASLILPLFILLFMNLLSVIEVHRIHSSVAESLWERGREEAMGAYLRNRAGDLDSTPEETGGEELQALLDTFGGQIRITKNLETYPIWQNIVAGEKTGFWVSEKIEDDGTIQIDCSYRIHPLFSFLTPITKTMENHYYGHAWVGYTHEGETGEKEEPYVYITETGTVYHKNRGCSYLNPSIRQVQSVEEVRNKGGGIYYACPLCGASRGRGPYFITDYGTAYHTSTSCSGLKRTIYRVKLSEVGGRGACNKCGR